MGVGELGKNISPSKLRRNKDFDEFVKGFGNEFGNKSRKDLPFIILSMIH
jgi:hypothetical protein